MAAVLDAVSWVARRPGLELPPLDASLAGWAIEKRRASHWNARRTLGGAVYHLKWFFHGPWRRPAQLEWRNAERVARLGIPTVVAAGWGRHPHGSFVVLLGSPGHPLSEWRARGLTPVGLLPLAAELARMTARLHDGGLCHRDHNVYHVLVAGDALRLIDVGRVAPFIRRRWIVKDLASLRASAEREGVPRQAQRCFLRAYLLAAGRGWRRRALLSAVLQKAAAYARHEARREARRGALPDVRRGLE